MNGIDPLFQEYAPLTARELLARLRPRIERRTKMLAGVYTALFNEWTGVFLNPDLLFEAVASCYCDMYRLKFFRNVQWVDDHKKAAYTMKWIARIRPIQIHRGAVATPASIKANACYAAYCGLALLGIRKDWETNEWWGRWLGNMIYLLHYHSAPVEFLSSEMCALKTLDDSGE